MNLNDNDVLDLEKSPRLGANATCKISELHQGLRSRFSASNGAESPDFQFFKDGVECKLLSANGGGWQKGKLKYQLVFIPDEATPEITDAVMGGHRTDQY
ncbi:hypothetical protein CAL7716_072400 [Calothrix sp. PCC 7716]|nr:hypothetical protein CAL7716_072400 [Calothrix sp. PCC 7716]